MPNETFSMVGLQSLVALMGINGLANMMVFGIQKALITLPEWQKFWGFWAGFLVLSFALTWLVFNFMYKKGTNPLLILGVVGLGIMVMLLFSPIISMFFPIDPANLEFGIGLQAGGSDFWVVPPVLLGLGAVLVGIGYARKS